MNRSSTVLSPSWRSRQYRVIKFDQVQVQTDCAEINGLWISLIPAWCNYGAMDFPAEIDPTWGTNLNRHTPVQLKVHLLTYFARRKDSSLCPPGLLALWLTKTPCQAVLLQFSWREPVQPLSLSITLSISKGDDPQISSVICLGLAGSMQGWRSQVGSCMQTLGNQGICSLSVMSLWHYESKGKEGLKSREAHLDIKTCFCAGFYKHHAELSCLGISFLNWDLPTDVIRNPWKGPFHEHWRPRGDLRDVVRGILVWKARSN